MTWEKGEKVAIKTGPHHAWYYEIVPIFKITKTQIVLMDGRRFRKANNKMVGYKGSTWRCPYIEPITGLVWSHNAKYEEDQRKRELINKIRETNFDGLSIETLEKIVRLCEMNNE